MCLKASNTKNLSTSFRGHFLLAMPHLNTGLFAKSLTYLTEHGKDGAMGLIINRPLDITVSEIFDQLEIETASGFDRTPVMAGGPVQTDRGFVLHRDKNSNWDTSIEVGDEILLTTSKDILCSIAKNEGPSENLIALGYAGWSAGQLEDELAKNTWLTMPADSNIIFSTPFDQRLSRAADQLGIDMNLIISQAGHA